MKKFLLFCLISLPIFAAAQSNSSVDIMLSPDVTYRTRQYETPEIYGFTTKLIDSVEKPQLSYHVGVNFNRRLTSKIHFKTGVQIAKLSYTILNTNITWGNQNNNGNFQPSADPEGLVSVRSLTYVNVPIAVRYEFSDKKIAPFVELGFVPMYSVANNVKTVDRNGADVFDKPLSNFTNFAVMLHWSLGLNYRINDEWQAFFQPTIRYELTQSNSFSYAFFGSFKEHNYSIGSEFGLRMSL